MRIGILAAAAASAALVVSGLAPADAGDTASRRVGGGTAPAVRATAATAAPTGALTWTATRSGAGARADVISCHGAFTGSKAYDAPHPSKSSHRRRVNAHLSIVCTGGGAGATLVTVTSRMVDGHRVGAPSTKSGLRRARTGGDLRCIRKKRAYQAKGRVHIEFPPGYEPPTATAHPRSVIRVFRRAASGRCVRP
jgi:hypothetical protein